MTSSRRKRRSGAVERERSSAPAAAKPATRNETKAVAISPNNQSRNRNRYRRAEPGRLYGDQRGAAGQSGISESRINQQAAVADKQ